MCGLVGLWNVSTERPHATVCDMLEAMKHRGPDGRGTLEYAGGAAGMVRLALVDLSERGQQPIWSADRRVAILYNGEIYNFRAERERLLEAGHRFRTHHRYRSHPAPVSGAWPGVPRAPARHVRPGHFRLAAKLAGRFAGHGAGARAAGYQASVRRASARRSATSDFFVRDPGHPGLGPGAAAGQSPRPCRLTWLTAS